MAEVNQNLWAPWRMEYIHSLAPGAEDEGCFLCNYWETPADDPKNYVVWRTDRVLVVMNRFPYTNGHLLIAPAGHVGDLGGLGDAVLAAMMNATRDAVALLADTVNAHGYNIGINLGRCAGAGLPDHVHTHVVPRWNGDTNYMAIVGNVRVIPQALDALYGELAAGAVKRGLRVP